MTKMYKVTVPVSGHLRKVKLLIQNCLNVVKEICKTIICLKRYGNYLI